LNTRYTCLFLLLLLLGCSAKGMYEGIYKEFLKKMEQLGGNMEDMKEERGKPKQYEAEEVLKVLETFKKKNTFFLGMDFHECKVAYKVLTQFLNELLKREFEGEEIRFLGSPLHLTQLLEVVFSRKRGRFFIFEKLINPQCYEENSFGDWSALKAIERHLTSGEDFAEKKRQDSKKTDGKRELGYTGKEVVFSLIENGYKVVGGDEYR